MPGDAGVQRAGRRTGFFDPLLLPRLGFTYDLEVEGFFSRSQLQGGVGIFSGGDPTVWFSNAYQNSGIALGFGFTGNNPACGTARIDVVSRSRGTTISVVTGGVDPQGRYVLQFQPGR